MFKKIKIKLRIIMRRVHLYITRLLHPYYLFPIKLITYSLYYLIRALGRLIVEILRIVRDMLVFPFLSLRNLLKSLIYIFLAIYIPASIFVIYDYMQKEYGNIDKFFCSGSRVIHAARSVVKVVGYGRGSGFFVSPNEVLTSYHVIDNSPTPKVVLPDNTIPDIRAISALKDADLAVIELEENYPQYVLRMGNDNSLTVNEKLNAIGYAWDAEIESVPVMQDGLYRSTLRSEAYDYVMTNIILNHGMSGGPLVDRCGEVVGVNTAGVGGLTFFVSSNTFYARRNSFSHEGLPQLKLDPSGSPEQGVIAFYSYIKARNLIDGFKLLSKSYLNWTTYEEWTARFANIIDVTVLMTVPDPHDPEIIFVKFMTTALENGYLTAHYYQGTWETVHEDGVYKMNRSKIKEVTDPPSNWTWTGAEF